jgi:hypothetical protein
MSVACTFESLRVHPIEAGADFTITFQRNGIATALACTVSAGDCSSSSPVAVAVGDLVRLEYAGAGLRAFSAILTCR